MSLNGTGIERRVVGGDLVGLHRGRGVPTVVADPDRAAAAAGLLSGAIATTGLLGCGAMPVAMPPAGVVAGSLEHVLYLTLGATIRHQRIARELWEGARLTHQDRETRYLFTPGAVADASIDRVAAGLQRHGLSSRPRQDALIWRTVARTLEEKWGGDPREFINDCGWDALVLLRRLRADRHSAGARCVPDYPGLRGERAGALWIRSLRSEAGLSDLRNLERVPIPVDQHIARASLALGVVRGSYSGSLAGIRPSIREAWTRGVDGLVHGDRPMVALDLEAPLRMLSRAGCVARNAENGYCPRRYRCEAAPFCQPGIIDISPDWPVRLDT